MVQDMGNTLRRGKFSSRRICHALERNQCHESTYRICPENPSKCPAVRPICREYGISRRRGSKRPGYKWKNRFVERGLDGLQDQSRKPDKSPNELDEGIICRIVKLKLAHPHWGPNKIRAIFAREDGDRLSGRILCTESDDGRDASF